MDKKAVIFIGPPGSGKGTQAVLLKKEFGFHRIESSRLIENKFKNVKEGDSDYEEVMAEKKRFDEGLLSSPSFITQLMVKEIQKLAKDEENIVMEGSPRTIYEAEAEIPVLIEEYGKDNIILIHMPMPEEISIKRNSRRRICKSNRHPIPWTPETEDLKICPEDGSPLISRGVLDDPETIKIRLKQYKEKTEPILKLVEDKFGIKQIIVDGELPIDAQSEEVKKIVEV